MKEILDGMASVISWMSAKNEKASPESSAMEAAGAALRNDFLRINADARSAADSFAAQNV